MAEVVDVLLRARGEFSDLTGKISSLRKEFQSLKLPKDITENLEKGFNRLEPILKSYQRQLDKGFKTKTDLKNFEAMRHELDAIFSDINSEIQKVNGQPVQLKADLKEITALEKKLDNFSAKLQKALDKISIDRGKQVAGDIERLVAATNKASSIKPMTIKAQDLFNQQDFAAFNSEIDKIQNKILGLSNVRGAKVDLAKAIMGPNFTSDVQAMDAAIQKFFNDLKVPDKAMNGIAEINRDITQTGTALSQVKTDSLTRGAQVLAELGGSAQKASQNARELGDSIDGAASSSVRMAEELQQLKTSTQYFFSLRNMINLFKRGVREAVDVIKELDAAMTETAVVTEYSVGDMWKKLPEYTSNANALGATVKDMYEATTLYYQQGLNTDQAMSIATETMKMARIAGLEAADATDKMTAALRGFNMELNETSAQRINDVYSNLAAKTASDTEELGTAMQRTASIAHSAGMSFEGTAAFLAQAIETTREPAENIGTAMKTIVARFQEMKKNPLELTEVEGEEVSFNKVDQALQSIGVSLKDANGQFRALDQVFLEISQRWDSLSQTQQRYIATTAAGSRQQSRFIAMMSNYDRTLELMNYANNSAGASNEQFGKTMESLEAKLNKLKNAWNEFLMGIMNDSMTKFVVDAGTTLLGILNKITDALSFGGKSGLLKSITSLTAAFMGLKVAGKAINWGVDKAGGLLSPSTPMFGFKGEGGKVSKTTATIVNPIVAEIRQVVAAIKSQPLKTGTSEVGTLQQYKDSQTNLRNLLGLNDKKLLNGSLIDAKRTLSYSQVTDNLKGLSDTQQRQLLGTLPGLQQAMRGATLNMLSNNGVSKDSQRVGQQITKDIIKGMNKGTISVEKGIDLLKNPQKWGKYFGNQFNEGSLQEIGDTFNKLNKEYDNSFNKLVEEARSNYKKKNPWMSDAEIAKHQSGFEAYAKHKMGDRPGEQIDYTKYSQLGDKIGQVGAGFATAGQSVQQFGVVLSNLGLEKTGALLMRVGSSISSLGMAFNGLGTILPKIQERFADAGSAAVKAFTDAGKGVGGAAKGGGAFFSTLFGNPATAIAAGVAAAALVAVAIHKHLEKKAREAGEDVRKRFEEGFEKADEKINSLEGYKDRFNDLAKGVDQFGHNVNLSAEEYDEYLSISRELQQISPSLIAGYNAEGQAIIKKGEAIQEVIDKLEEEKQAELRLFTSDTSVDKLIGEYKTSDTYKQYKEKGHMSQGEYEIDRQAFEDAKNSLAGLDEEVVDAINQLTGWNLENLNNLTTSQLSWISKNYNDVIGLIEEQNGVLDEEVKEGYIDAFTNAGAAIQDVMSEGQPIVDALQMWMGAEGLDATGLNLGEEFAYSFNQGMQSIMLTGLTEGWDADTFKDNLRDYSKEWNRLAGENSKYNQILSEAQELQENYLDTVGQADAIDNYKQQIEASAVALEQLAEAQDTSTAAGQAFAEQCVAQANALRNYATEGVMSLGEALNSLSDEFASARNAKERFDKATEGGDYYTAAEGYKGIIDTILDDKNLAGNGSLTFWAGADELLGKDFVDSSSYDEVVKQINRVKGAFEDGSDGVIAFNNYLTDMWYELGGENGKLAGLGTVGSEGFEFNLQNEDLAEYAELLHISEDALAALIDKARQWVPISLGDPRKIRAALEVDAGSMIGESKNEAGKQTLYYSESAFRNEARQQGIRGDDYTATRDTVAKEQNVKFLTVEDLTTKGGELSFDNVADDLGLKGADKTLDNSVALLSKMGFGLEDTKKILESANLADGTITPEDIEKAYKEQEFATENPTVAGIKSNTDSIATAAQMMLAQMGIVTDELKANIDQATDDNNLNSFKTGLDSADTYEQYQKEKAKTEAQIAEFRSMAEVIGTDTEEGIKLLEAADKLEKWTTEADDKWGTKIAAAASELDDVINNATSGLTDEDAKQRDTEFLQNQGALQLQSAIDSGSGIEVANLLKSWYENGTLSLETVTALTQEVRNLKDADTGDFLLDSRDALDALYADYLSFKKEVESGYQSFQYTSSYGFGEQADKNREYVQNSDISQDHKDLYTNWLITPKMKADDAITDLLTEFGGEDTQTKTIILEAIAQYANGNAEGGQELLEQVLETDQVQQITPEIEVLTSGAVVDPEGLQQSLEGAVDKLDVGEDTKVAIKAAVEVEEPQEAGATYSTEIELKPNTTSFDKVVATAQQEGSKDIKLNAKKGTGWSGGGYTINVTANVTTHTQEAAHGMNNYIPHRAPIHIGGSSAKGRHGTIGPKDKGGLTLTGEKGFEIAWLPSENRSMILGAKGPQMLNLPNDAVVYTHEQSKRILSQKGIPAGSHDSDTTRSAGLLSGISGGGGGGGTVKAAKKAAKDVSKAATNSEKAIGNVIVWWDNIARKTEASQRRMDSALKSFEKFTKEMRATLKKTGESLSSGGGGGDDYLKKISDYMGYNQAQLDRANRELQTLDTGGGGSQKNMKSRYGAEGSENITQISYKKGKKSKEEFVNLAGYIKAQNGTYVVDQAALNSIGNAEKRKAVADAANKEIDDRLSKKYKAEDAIEKAQEAIEKMAEELYKTFFAWENELTKIWNLTKKIEATENNISRIKTYEETLNKQITTGLAKSSDRNHMAQTMEIFRQGLAESTDKIKTQTNLIEQQKKALQDALSIEDERTTLASIQAKLNQRQALDNITAQASSALSSARSNLSNAQQRAASKQSQIASLKAQKKKAKKKSKKNKIQNQINAAQNELNSINSTISYYQTQVNNATAAYNQAVANATNYLNDTEKLAYEQYAKTLQDQIEAQTAAQKYLSVRAKADGTVEVTFDTDAFEADKLQGSFTEDRAKAIQEYVKKIEETSADLSNAYKDANASVNELYDQLEQLENEWAEYANELWDIHEKEVKVQTDNFKKLSDSITKALKDLLDEVKRKLDERRKQEDNAKTERDISQKQQRLAALRADTAGGHQVEIAQLEREIADAQQNYQRTLEDQLLDKLQQQADLAAQQRERQIELQEAIVEGVNNAALVDLWMSNPEAYRDEIYEAYKLANEYDKKPEALRDQLDTKFEDLMAGLTTNQDKQEAVVDAIGDIQSTIDKIARSLLLMTTDITNAKSNGFSVSEAQSLLNASYSDLRTQGGYTAEDFAQSEVSYSQARQAFSAEELKSNGYYAQEAQNEILNVAKSNLDKAWSAYYYSNKGTVDAFEQAKIKAEELGIDTSSYNTAARTQQQKDAEAKKAAEQAAAARQAKINAYNAAIAAAHKAKTVTKATLADAINKGAAIGYGVDAVARALAAGDGSGGVTWKEVAKAAKKLGYGRTTVASWSPGSSALKNATTSKQWKKYAEGGLADYTGPAWLDGTPSKPELVLNAKDTQNFLILKDILRSALKSTGSINNSYDGDATYEININVDHLNNDYDVDKVAERVKKIIVKDAGYRNVTQVRNLR